MPPQLAIPGKPKPRNKRYWAALAVGIASLCILTGCAPTINPDDYPATSPARLPREVSLREYAACMEGNGWPLTINYEEGSTTPVDPIHESQLEIYLKDGEACNLKVEPIQYTYTDLSLYDRQNAYNLLLDSRTCLINLGFDIGEAPSFQTFDSDEADWTPFTDIPRSELRKSEETCPQPYY